MPQADLVRLNNVKAVRGTDKAILCEVDGEEAWIPQSQIHEDSEVWQTGQEGTLVIPEWLAKAKNLI